MSNCFGSAGRRFRSFDGWTSVVEEMIVPIGARYGVEPFDVSYGSSHHSGESPLDVECPLVEDDSFKAHTPEATGVPDRLAFVDGVMRTEARLTCMEADGTIASGLAGSWAAGAVLASGKNPLKVDYVKFGRVSIFCRGHSARLPAQGQGQGGTGKAWSWQAESVDSSELDAAHDRLRRTMRDAEGALGEALALDGWLTIVDGPLNNVRATRTAPIVGYVKTHQRRMLEPSIWARVPELAVRERSTIFAIEKEAYACYLRVGEVGPWSSPWGGIVRLEVPTGSGRRAAIVALDRAAAFLPKYASSLHRDPRAPVNLTPIAGLESALRRCMGDAALALRAVRAAVLQLGAIDGVDE